MMMIMMIMVMMMTVIIDSGGGITQTGALVRNAKPHQQHNHSKSKNN